LVGGAENTQETILFCFRVYFAIKIKEANIKSSIIELQNLKIAYHQVFALD